MQICLLIALIFGPLLRLTLGQLSGEGHVTLENPASSTEAATTTATTTTTTAVTMTMMTSTSSSTPPVRSLPIAISKVIETCVNLSPNRMNSVSNNKVAPIRIDVTVWPERFVAVGDVADETLSLSATIRASWSMVCEGQLNGSFYAYGDDSLIRKFWHVPLQHANKADFSRTISSLRSLHRTLQVKSLDRHFFFDQDLYGVFNTICDFDFYAFPFDSHHCPFVVEVNLPEQVAVVFGSLVLPDQVDANFSFSKSYYHFNSGNSFWSVEVMNVGSQQNHLKSPDFLSDDYGRQHVLFLLKFTRKWSHLLYNLLLPLLLLTVLELFGLMLPPGDNERPLYSAILLVAIVALRSEILAATPMTSTRIFMHDYVMLETLIAVLCTLQAVVMTRVYSSSKYSLQTNIRWGKPCCSIKAIKIPDIVTFTLGSGGLIALHIYAFLNFYPQRG